MARALNPQRTLRRLAAAALLARAAAVNPLALTLDAATGRYTLTVSDGSFPALSLASGDTFVVVNGATLSSGDGSLVPGGATVTPGRDAWGAFEATAVEWSPSGGGAGVMHTTFRVYADVPAVTFEQSFAEGVPATGGSYAARDGVASAFPSFALPPAAGGLGFMQHVGPFVDDGTNGPRFGAWAAGAPLASGLAAGSGPLTLFDASGAAAVVLSAASEFMAGSSAVVKTADGGSALAYGVFASAKAVPPAWSFTTVAWYGGAGVNTAVMAWGAALLLRYYKPHGLSKTDYTNTRLGYNTDHGACEFPRGARRELVKDRARLPPPGSPRRLLLHNGHARRGGGQVRRLRPGAGRRRRRGRVQGDPLPVRAARQLVVLQGHRGGRQELDGHARARL